MRLSLVRITACAVALVFPFAVSAVTLDEIEAGLSDRKTDAQKERFWRDNENSPLVVTGSVVEVEESGVILPAIITLEVRGSSFKVRCWLRESQNSKIYDFDVGDRVTCSGIFETYSEFLEKSVVVGSAMVSKE